MGKGRCRCKSPDCPDCFPKTWMDGVPVKDSYDFTDDIPDEEMDVPDEDDDDFSSWS